MKLQHQRRLNTAFPLTLILFLFLLGGCGKVANIHHDADYDPMARDGAKYAVGGFVLGAQAELDRQAEIGTPDQNADPRYQTETWAPVLYGPMLTRRDDLEVWAWTALRENIPVDTITAVQTAYARGSVMPPAMFTQVAGDLPDITYLVLARIDRNDIEIGSNTPANLGNQAAIESRDPHTVVDQMTRTIKTRRTVAVSLDVYDLRSGRSVWSSSVERNLTELYSADNEDTGEELVVTPAVEEGDLPEIMVKGASLAMPALDDVLAVACAALVKDLFAVPE